MIGRIEWFLLELRRWISRSEWIVRFLGLSRSEGTETERGLVLIQVDGLSHHQLERAIKDKRMPFLEGLIRKEAYQLHPLYSGLPSNTPGFQGELFYGVKCVVPGFNFQSQRTKQHLRMFDPRAAAQIERMLQEKDPGLLRGGSSYSGILSGGAQESHFCPATVGWSNVLRAANPLTWVIFSLWQAWSLVRVGALLVLEFALAIVDGVRGLIAGQDLWKELKFVPTRVAVSILLRELVTIGAKMDTARGLPIIHLNYLGYDEQAHRRGPSSAFAHWTLKGIDDAIKRVWQAARRSSRRDYEIWIFSDHGQEKTVPFGVENGRSIHDAVRDVIGQNLRSSFRPHQNEGGIELKRAKWLGGTLARWLSQETTVPVEAIPQELLITAMGPLGHIYLEKKFESNERGQLARALVQQAKIPLVLVAEPPDRIRAWTEAGEFSLPKDAAKILGADHPFLEEVARDLVALCHHPDSGTFVISGWRTKGLSISFPSENGAHAGPGRNETSAFALLPPTAPIRADARPYLRPLDLRQGVMRTLERAILPDARRVRQGPQKDKTIRMMTYNVHSCIGMDGKISPDRIAKVIALYNPDVVALQELDVGRMRTKEVDQVHRISQILEMDYHFHPALQLEEEKYGNAVLSHHPMRVIRAGGLPGLPNRPFLEPRGALWVAISVQGYEFHLINTHLGLLRRERLLQAEALMGPEWIGHPACKKPIVLCGDFNAPPGSPVCQNLSRRLEDAQSVLNDHQPKGTWFSRYPVRRIDHVFVDRTISILSVDVPRTALTRLASDHLPLVVEMHLP